MPPPPPPPRPTLPHTHRQASRPITPGPPQAAGRAVWVEPECLAPSHGAAGREGLQGGLCCAGRRWRLGPAVPAHSVSGAGPFLAGSLWGVGLACGLPHRIAFHPAWTHCQASVLSSCDTIPHCCTTPTTRQVRAFQPPVCHRGAGAPLVWRGQPRGCCVGHLCHAGPCGQQGGRPLLRGRAAARGAHLTHPLVLHASTWESRRFGLRSSSVRDCALRVASSTTAA